MGIAGFPDIYQWKMLELMSMIHYVSSGEAWNHLEKLRKVLTKLEEAGSKVNDDKLKLASMKPNIYYMYSQEMESNHNDS